MTMLIRGMIIAVIRHGFAVNKICFFSFYDRYIIIYIWSYRLTFTRILTLPGIKIKEIIIKFNTYNKEKLKFGFSRAIRNKENVFLVSLYIINSIYLFGSRNKRLEIIISFIKRCTIVFKLFAKRN